MTQKEFTQEQLAMLADCILAQIRAWASVGDSVYPSDSLNAVKTAEIGKLRTMLDYINDCKEE